MNRSYEDFRDAVKEQLKDRLSAWELSDEDLEKYVQKEEDQIKSAYEAYTKPRLNDDRTNEARFSSGVSTVSMCLEYCYE